MNSDRDKPRKRSTSASLRLLVCATVILILCGIPAIAAVELHLTPVGNAVFAGSEQTRSLTVEGLSPQTSECTVSWSIRTTPGRRTLRAAEHALAVKQGRAVVTLRFPVPPTRPGVLLPLRLDCAVSEVPGHWMQQHWELLAVHRDAASGILPADLTLITHSPDEEFADQLREAGLTVRPVRNLQQLLDQAAGVLAVKPDSEAEAPFSDNQLWDLLLKGWKILVIQPPPGIFLLPRSYAESLAAIRLVDQRIVEEIHDKINAEFDIPHSGLAFGAHNNHIAVETGSRAGRCVWAEFVNTDNEGILAIFTLPRMESEVWKEDARARYLFTGAIRYIVERGGEKGNEK